MAKIQYRDSKGHFRNPSNYDGDLYTYVDGVRVKIKSAGEERITPIKRDRKIAKTVDEWLKNRAKSEANEDYRRKQSGKRELKVGDRLPSSMDTTTASYISTEGAHKRWQERMKEYVVKTDANGNPVATRAIDEYNQKIYQESKERAAKDDTQIVYDEKEQASVVDLFEEANKQMADWEEEYGITVGRGFHLYKSDTLESLEKKVERALEVTNDDYLKRLALSYKLDFISNFANHVQGDDFARFVDAVARMNNLDFLKLIKDKHIDFLAYALDSIIDRHGFEQILSDIRYLTDRIEANLKGE